MIVEDAYTVTLLEGSGIELGHRSGSITMDDGWAPRVQGSIEVPIPDQATLELIDSRPDRRVEVACSASYSEGGTTARTFDLGLRGRKVNHRTGTITLDLASDEALLMDDRLVADEPNTDALAYQSSLRALIDNVILSRHGAALEPGSADAQFRVLWDATNPIANGLLRTTAAGWKFNNGGFGDAARVAVANPPEPGLVWCASVTGLGAGTDRGLFYQGGITGVGVPVSAVTAGGTYHARAWVRTNSAVPVSLRLEWANSAGATIGTSTGAEVVTIAGTTTWVLVEVTAVAPTGAARVAPYCYTRAGYVAPAGLTFQMCGLTGSGGDFKPDECWDGDTPDTLEYAYQWAGAASASAATRTALIDRSPDMLDWNPGESAWEFIQPLFQAVGLRLFADEQRRWFLVDGSYIAEGVTQLAIPVNIAEAVDSISRDDDEWFDAAIVIYRWTNFLGEREERIDHYAETGHTKVRTFVIERPYPGPGAAEYFVNRARGKGRTLKGITAVARFDTEPVQPVTVTLPSTPIQTGVVAAVTFDTGTGLMSIDTRGLTDTPPGSWLFGAPGVSWAELPAGMSWAEFTW